MTEELLGMRDDGVLARGVRRLAAHVPHTIVLGATVLLLAASLAAFAADGERASGLLLGGAVLGALLLPTHVAAGRLRWLDVAVVRAVEYGTLLLLGATAPSGAQWTYALLAVLAYHHYDLHYRRKATGEWPARWRSRLLLGWEVRLVALATTAAFGVGTAFVQAATVLWSTACVVETVQYWNQERRRPRGDVP